MPPVIGNDAVVPASVAGPMTPGVIPCADDGLQRGRVERERRLRPRASSSVSAGTASTFTLPSARPFLKADTPNAPLSARAAVRLSFAVSPRTFVPNPSRVTLGVPVRFRIVTRSPPSRAESVILAPTLHAVVVELDLHLAGLEPQAAAMVDRARGGRRVDAPAGDREADVAAGGLGRAGGRDLHAEVGEGGGGALGEREPRLAVGELDGGVGGGSRGQGRGGRRERMMLRFTGEPPDRGWLQRVREASARRLADRPELAQPRAPASRVLVEMAAVAARRLTRAA